MIVDATDLSWTMGMDSFTIRSYFTQPCLDGSSIKGKPGHNSDFFFFSKPIRANSSKRSINCVILNSLEFLRNFVNKQTNVFRFDNLQQQKQANVCLHLPLLLAAWPTEQVQTDVEMCQCQLVGQPFCTCSPICTWPEVSA